MAYLNQVVGQDGYLDMMYDSDRNNKYFAAIKSAIATRHANSQKAIVLDIGTGCGLLAMMAAKAGADQVYACEVLPFMFNCAKKVIARNNLVNIKLINKNSKEMIVGIHGDIPQKANILVTEIFGTHFLAEGAIETLNHANKHLLTDDCIHIPQKAVLFAQDCDLIDKMNSIGNISLPNGIKVNFPEKIKTCSNKTNMTVEMQLGALPTNKFLKLSNSLAIFEFCWNEQIPVSEANSIEFISRTKGNANAIFSWWDLHMDSTEENVISVKPTWAGGSNDNWRYGWMPQFYSGHCTLDLNLVEGTTCLLKAFHDETHVWFKICKASANSSQNTTCERFSNDCPCSIHCLWDTYQIAEANDVTKIEKYVTILQENIVPDKTTVLVLSEPDGTILHLLAAALGAKKVFLIPTHLAVKEYYRNATNMFISFNQFKDKIELLPSTIGNLKRDDFKNYKIDFVVGDPYFGKESCIEWHPPFQKPFQNPFHHLLYWKYLNFVKYDLGVLSLKCLISPATAIIKAIAMKFDSPLSRINCPIDTVCDEQFNIKDFAKLLQPLGSQPTASIDYQYLWQYPGVAASEPVQIMNFNFNEKITVAGLKRSSGILRLKRPADGFVVWIEWKTGDKTFSSGPTETPVVGQPVIWESYKKQGIHYNYNMWNKLIKWSVAYDYHYNTFDFKF